jgi:hypothetical protein
MKKAMVSRWNGALVISLFAQTAWAAGVPAQSIQEEVSNRMGHRLGLYLGVGEPAPALLGMNAAYNVTDFFRASAGFGKVSAVSGISIDGSGSMATTESSATTVGFGGKLFVPGWNISPTAGLGFAHLSYSGTPGFFSVGGFKESGNHVYASLGADYQAKSGFNAGLGLTQSFRSDVGTHFTVTAGWYVDWL